MAKILIAEDDPTIRAAYVFALNQAGFVVLEASDGAQAMKVLEDERPDAILLDMLMPGVSGLDFLRQTEIKKRYPDTKVIAFSNIDTPRVVAEARALGATDYLIKVNVTPHQTIDLIKGYLQKPTHK